MKKSNEGVSTMAGVKGRSGGKRAGAGRPLTVLPPLAASPANQTPLEFLLSTMRDESADPKMRLDAAKSAAPFIHSRAGEIGVKDQKQEAAKKASTGKFAASKPPANIISIR
jgi:hypothetical protein